MTLGQKLQNAHLPKASKKRKTAETVEDVDEGGEITTRRAQQIAIGIEEKFFEDANQTKSRADATIGDSPVLFKAAVRDEGWDIEASEFILNIQWLKRMGRAKWWGLAGEQIITLTSVLPVRVQWKNTSTYQYQLSDPQHEELLHLCKCVRVLEPNFQRAADGQ